MPPPDSAEARSSRKLPNRPEAKLPPLAKGSRIQKRPLPRPAALRNEIRRIEESSREPTVAGLDGCVLPPRAPYTKVIRVSSSASFAGLLRRVHDALEDGPRRTNGMSLSARVAAAGKERQARNQSRQSSGAIEDRLDDVALVGAGRAIQKTMDLGAVFTRRKDLCVVARTSTVQSIDDIVAVDEEADVEDSSRVRNISCLEIGIRWVG